MTAVKCKQEYKTLLDFSKPTRRVSKNLVKQLLRQAEMPAYRKCDNEVIHTNYEINVGAYHIHLLFNEDGPDVKKKLRDYGSFTYELYERVLNRPEDDEIQNIIWVERDRRFKSQYWSNRNKCLRIKDLVNLIVYCSRLSNLKAFL